MVRRKRLVYLSHGVLRADCESAWRVSGVDAFVTLENAAPSGRRFGSLALGLGFDCILLALRGRLQYPRAQFLCASPWTGVALRILGVRDIAVIGIYSVPGGRSWRILRRFLGSCPVVCMVEPESSAWRAEGGKSECVRYGNSFGYKPAAERQPDTLRVFVGGMSDRDSAAVERLVEESSMSGHRIEIVIADGSGPRSVANGASVARWLPYVSNYEFGLLMSESDVVILPLIDKGRSAGHMVAVGALECGVRVLASNTSGFSGYFDGDNVRILRMESSLVDQAVEMARRAEPGSRQQVRDYWSENHSISIFSRSVIDAVRRLNV